MKLLAQLLACAGAFMSSASGVAAHFQEIIPSTDRYEDAAKPLSIDLVFTHPMDLGPAMPMELPAAFGVLGPDGKTDIVSTLVKKPVDGVLAWTAEFMPPAPGNYIFFVEPTPYWEASEGKSIIHYSKVVVDAYSWGDGWSELVGQPVEIEPLVRPYGLWTGNLFSGIVRRDGQPVKFAEIEVEWRNDGSLVPPGDAFVTQVIKADGNGVFHYALPRAGWWGFAALVEADYLLPDPSGVPRPVELGGLIWVNAVDMR